MDTAHWTKDDFTGFVLLYAASVDAEVQEDELDMIRKLLGEERTKELQKAGKNFSDYEYLQFIESERPNYFPGEEGKAQLMAEIIALFKSDGEYSQFEQVVARNLKRLL